MSRSEKGARDGAPSAGADDLGFDEHLGKLETIVSELEEGGLGLEAAIQRYQEGIEHLKRCHETLERHRARVEELTQGAELALRPFENDPDAGDRPG